MKAFKDSSNQARLFRPMENMKRFNKSAHRLRLPTFNEEGLLKCIEKLVVLEKDWIPSGTGYSLFIRPTLISTQDTLGVGAPATALFFTILSPVGPYFPSGFKPVKLLADDVNVRAYPGGTGGYKLGA
jgi:branched-chain amino acid aminotransferase